MNKSVPFTVVLFERVATVPNRLFLQATLAGLYLSCGTRILKKRQMRIHINDLQSFGYISSSLHDYLVAVQSVGVDLVPLASLANRLNLTIFNLFKLRWARQKVSVQTFFLI